MILEEYEVKFDVIFRKFLKISNNMKTLTLKAMNYYREPKPHKPQELQELVSF